MTILGIDPGFRFTGFGIVKKELQTIYLVHHGCLKLSSSQSLAARIGIFYNFFEQNIIEYQVSGLALETPFLGKNAQNFLKLGYLRGILYLLADRHKLILHEFAPREVKQAVTGYGGASKEQVADMVLRLFPKMQPEERADITDALAVTLCGVWSKSPTI